MDYLNRRLGLVEHLFSTLHSLGAMLYVNVAHIQGSIPFEILRNAVNLLQKQHPLLQVCIQKSEDNHLYFTSDTNLLIPLQLLEQDYKKQWVEIAENEMLQAFSCEVGPLCRITFLKAKEETDVSQLIMTFHHAIADGNSAVYLIDELLSYCNNLTEGIAISPADLASFQPPLEKLLEKYLSDPKTLNSTQNVSSKVDISQTLIIEGKSANIEERTTNLITHRFNQKVTQKLQDRCRQENTTIHGALCAAMLVAASKETLKNNNPSLLSCSSSVDLRPFCSPPVAKNILGCLISNVTTTHFLDPETNFWELSRKCLLSVRQLIESKMPHHQVSNPELVTKYQLSLLKQMAEHNMGRSTTTHVSNLGKFSSPNEREHFRIKEFYFATGLHIVGTCFWLGVVTLNGQMNCTFTYVSPLLSQKTAESLVNNVILTLEQAVI